MFLPEAVLRHCDGVKAEKLEGKNNSSLFFLDQECHNESDSESTRKVTSTSDHVADGIHCLQPALGSTTSGTHTVDELAAEDFICLSQKEFHGQPWPASKKQLKQFWLKKANAPKLSTWVQSRFSDATTAGKKRNGALNCLMDQLKRSKFLRGTKTILDGTWWM